MSFLRGDSPKSWAGYSFALVAAALWGSTAVVTKVLLGHLGNLEVLMCSSLVAAVTLFVICWQQNKLPILRSYKGRDVLTLAMLGFIGVFAYRFLLQASISVMPAQSAFILNYSWPVMVILFAIPILGEKLTAAKLFAVVVSFTGVAVIATGGHFSNLQVNITGVVFALSGAAIYGLFSVIGKKTDYDRFVSTFIYYAFTFVFASVALAFSNLPALSYGQQVGLIWLGIGPGALGFVAFSLALKRGNTAAMSNTVLITPFLSLVYVAIFLHESISQASILGLLMIVAGILVQSIWAKRPTTEPTSPVIASAYEKNEFVSAGIDVQAHYQRLAPRFESNWAYNGTYVKRMSKMLLSALQVQEGSKLADVGGGTALYGEHLARRSGSDSPVFCVDPSPEMLEFAERKANVVPILSSAQMFGRGEERSVVPERFDAILIRDAIHHFANPEQTLTNISRDRLMPGGRLVVAMLPTTLHLPLFKLARERLEALQPEPFLVVEALTDAGLQVQTTNVNSALSFSRDRYLQMVRDRYLSVLSVFSDEELETGISEMAAVLPDEVAFIESFVFAIATKPLEPADLALQRNVISRGKSRAS